MKRARMFAACVVAAGFAGAAAASGVAVVAQDSGVAVRLRGISAVDAKVA